ncbi:hypothetical protein A9Q89_08465 [Gammaproteobacteria bacterium 53_120_T64]|nr:hypothetical protein A9Q89_08465 [Gammaproteobacteria bacterium 53_120_T64]
MIKRLIFRIIMMLALAAGIMSYLASINGIDIRQFLPSFERPKLPNIKLPTMPDIKLPGTDGQDATISKVYKWRGADGSWHFSENLPEGVTAEQVILLNSETNVVQGWPGAPPVKTAAEPSSAPAPVNTPPITLNPYSKKAIEKLLDDARGVQDIMDQRSRDLEQASQ